MFSEKSDMLFYCHTITNRIRYITGFIGGELTGKPFQLITDRDKFREYKGAKINYSNEKITADECWISPHSLLFEQNIQKQQVDCFSADGQHFFFKTEGELSFDIFAASFYLLSRYEEYLPHQKDNYGRYDHTNSLAFTANFLKHPLINTWLKDFRQMLQDKFPHSLFSDPSFRFLPTYDIDEAYSYKYKNPWRTVGAVGKAFLKGQWTRIAERKRVLSGKMQDPYDSYAWIDELHGKYGLNPRYFFLVAQQTGRYDKNNLPGEEAMKDLIRQHADKYTIGVHPSWQSGDDPSLIAKEKEIVENAAGYKINSSRQHFIRFTLPETYRYLLEAGINEDFSMGYATVNGFRASVASSFYWYDLEKEETTNLLLYPFCYMDANSYYEEKVSAQIALEDMKYYYHEVKKVNGLLVTLWHNTYLGTDRIYCGWREAYEEFIAEVHGRTGKVNPA